VTKQLVCQCEWVRGSRWRGHDIRIPRFHWCCQSAAVARGYQERRSTLIKDAARSDDRAGLGNETSNSMCARGTFWPVRWENNSTRLCPMDSRRRMGHAKTCWSQTRQPRAPNPRVWGRVTPNTNCSLVFFFRAINPKREEFARDVRTEREAGISTRARRWPWWFARADLVHRGEQTASVCNRRPCPCKGVHPRVRISA
jgi:hypothetical protein